MRRKVGVFVVGVALAASGLLWAVEAPVAVSPGDASKVAPIEARCPTFSWGEAEGAKSYELLVYRLGEEDLEARPVLQQEVLGSASSWTPSLESCLQRGGQYAWTVRAVDRKKPSEWSAPSLFEVAAGPSREEFEAALQVVTAYLEGSKTPGGTAPAAPPGRSPTETTSGGLALPPVAVSSRTAAPAESAFRAATFSGESAFRAEVSSSELATEFAVQGLLDNLEGFAAVYGEVTNPSNEGLGVAGVTVSLFGRGVAGINVAPDDEHPEGVHGIALQGQSQHSPDGIGVVGVGDGVGVQGSGDIGVLGVGFGGYGGFFESLSGDLIGAESSGDTENPTFRVDNSGKVFAPAIDLGTGAFEVDNSGNITATSINLGVFGNMTRSNQPGGTLATASCDASELMVGGGCKCGGGGTVVASIPDGGNTWRCQCPPMNIAEAWAVCLKSS